MEEALCEVGSDQNVWGEFLREWSGCGVSCLLEGLPKLPGHGPGPPWSGGLDQMMSRESFQPQPFCAFVRSRKIHVCLMTE